MTSQYASLAPDCPRNAFSSQQEPTILCPPEEDREHMEGAAGRSQCSKCCWLKVSDCLKHLLSLLPQTVGRGWEDMRLPSAPSADESAPSADDQSLCVNRSGQLRALFS